MNYKRFIYKSKKSAGAGSSGAASEDGFDEEKARKKMAQSAERIAYCQDLLMAHEERGLLIIFQGMDGAGKDSMIKNVMSSLDPQGAEMKMFKEPTEKEVKHDFLWRAAQNVPARGQIGIFNRSYYESVITERVRPEKLARYNFPKSVLSKNIWKKRYAHINNFEAYLFDNGIHTLKFFLNQSKEKQRENLLERLTRPDKQWKFAPDDLEDRELWDEYLKAYDEAFTATSTRQAPWYIIPDDNRWYARAAVAEIIFKKLESFHEKYPVISGRRKEEIKSARQKLEAESGK